MPDYNRHQRQKSLIKEPKPSPVMPFRRSTWAALVFVFLLSLSLNTVGIKWGLPSVRTWCNDTIAGMPTVYHRGNLFTTWKFKYPRVQFLINSACYEPFLRYWAKHPVTTTQSDGQPAYTALNLDRTSVLVLIACGITALMGAGTVVVIFLSARLLFHDDWIALLAGIAAACAHEFVFYSHTGNVDVPAVFWCSWTFYGCIKAIQKGYWRHYLLLAIFAALAVCTKDPTIGAVVGVAVALLAFLFVKARQHHKSRLGSIGALFTPKTVVALVLFLFLFALLNNILSDPQGYWNRMTEWQHSHLKGWQMPKGITTQLKLILLCHKNLYIAYGWPMLLLIYSSVIYGLIRYTRKTLMCLLPFITFYLIVITTIRFSVPRFYLPACIGLFIIVGTGAADWLRFKRIPKVIRWTPIIFIYAASFFYSLGVGLEMKYDSRNRTVEWFRDNVDRNAWIATLTTRWYAPFPPKAGFTRYSYPWSPPNGKIHLPTNQLPDYIITGLAYQNVKSSHDFYQALVNGKLPYTIAAQFDSKFFRPHKTIFSFAGWPYPRRMISPLITVWKKNTLP